MPIRSNLSEEDVDQVVITFDALIQRTEVADRMKRILNLLERYYKTPVDMEFALHVDDPQNISPDIKISILQCRPQSHAEEEEAYIPDDLDADDIIFSTGRVVPQGYIADIRYVLFVVPEGYYALPTPSTRSELGRAIGRINNILANEVFICIGPGRWGTRNPDLGVNIRYADIYNARSLVELTGEGIGLAPEPSFGTHFFQDLVEARIYPLAIFLDDEDVIFNHEFFYNTPNRLTERAPEEANFEGCLRIIEVSSYMPKHHLDLVMDSEAGQAVAILCPD